MPEKTIQEGMNIVGMAMITGSVINKVIRLIEIEGQAILEAQTPGLLPFTPLMKPPTEMTPEQWVQQCIDATIATPVESPTKGNLLYGLSVFGGLVHDQGLFERIPEELMQESSFFQHQREKFIAEGITQGAKEATLKNLLTVLNAKFHTEAVRALTPALKNIDDLQRLEELHLTAINVGSLEAFTENLFE
jgi:hypothetical protein